jgi:uncharacterized membrane protein YphA (DoxX/SURF4 family)
MNPTNDGRVGRIIYWIATLVAATAFAVPGVANLAHTSHIVHDMAHLGYPSYFLTALGTWKVLGAIAILAPRFPRLKEWAYAGMIFDLTGAAFSRAAMQDGLLMAGIPLCIGLIVVVSWTLRPASRVLSASPLGVGH